MYIYLLIATYPSSPSMVLLLFFDSVTFLFSTLILTLPPCILNCLSNSLINAKSSAGRSLNLSVISAIFFRDAFEEFFLTELTFFGYEVFSVTLEFGVFVVEVVVELEASVATSVINNIRRKL